jgi:hypothetical protein
LISSLAPTSPRIRLRPKAGFGGQERGEVKLASQARFRNWRGILPLSITDQFRLIFNAKCRLNLYAFR